MRSSGCPTSSSNRHSREQLAQPGQTDPAHGQSSVGHVVPLEPEPEVAHAAQDHAGDDAERAERGLERAEQLVVPDRLGAQGRGESGCRGGWLSGSTHQCSVGDTTTWIAATVSCSAPT